MKLRLQKYVEMFQNRGSVQVDVEQGLSCSCMLILFSVQLSVTKCGILCCISVELL